MLSKRRENDLQSHELYLFFKFYHELSNAIRTSDSFQFFSPSPYSQILIKTVTEVDDGPQRVVQCFTYS